MDFGTSRSSSSASTVSKCSICMEDVSDDCGRTVVKLRCSHLFHLDCIGSAFNVKGIMECPNCREIENGVWRCFGEGSSEAELLEGMNVETVEFIDMGSLETLRHHERGRGLATPDYMEPHFEDEDGNVIYPHVTFVANPNANHQGNGPTIPSEIFTPRIDWRVEPFICDSCVDLLRSDHASGPSTTLRTATAAFDGIPNESFGPQVLDHGTYVQTTIESPFGLAYQGSDDPVYPNFERTEQPPTNPSSPAARSSMRISNGLRGWFPTEHTAPSLEQNEDSISLSLNLVNSNQAESAAHSHHHVQERNAIEPLQLFPENAGSFHQDMHD